MTTIIADYEAERRAVLDLFQPECACRIVLLRGASGSGKSTLLRHCLENCPPQASYLSYDFKGDIPVAEVFYRAGQRLTWPRLPALTQQVTQMQETPSVKVDSNWLAGINNRINVALHAESPVDREHRRALLTNAFFDDLQAFDRPVVMVFDTFEKASTEVQRWLSGPMLARAAFINNVRVVIAGQEAPAPNIEWGHCCREHELYGVRDARHWLPVVQAMDRYIPFNDPMTWLAGELAPWLREVFTSAPFRSRPYWRPGVVLDLLDRHVIGAGDYSAILWRCLTVELWHQVFAIS